MKNFKRTLITTALPYANGPVHIGHLAGVYVPADIYARYLRLRGEEVLMIGGSDEHGVPITIKAKKEGVTPQNIVDRYHNIIKDSFEGLGISFDVYGRTTSETHRRTASEFFRRLYEKGEFIEKTSMQLYDEEAGQFLADRYVTGTCPHCGNENAYGDQCEACGTSLNATDLINPRSALTPNRQSPAMCLSSRRHPTGTCLSTNGRDALRNGFSRIIRNGRQTSTVSASHGSIWACSPAP